MGVDLKMRFTLNDPKFFMNGLAAVATNVRLQARDLKMKFYACMVKVRSDVYNKIATARLQKNLDVYYPTVRSEIRTYTLQNNHTNFEASRLWKGKSTRISLCNLLQTTVNMTCQGIRLISANCSAYRGKCMIKPEHWGDDQHTTLYMWDNVASGCADSVQLNPKQEGRVKIAITKTAVNSLITVIVYGEFENMMQIKPTVSTQYDIYSQKIAGRIQ